MNGKLEAVDRRITDLEIAHNRLEERVESLEEWQKRQNGSLQRLEEKVNDINQRLDEKIDSINERLDKKTDGISKWFMTLLGTAVIQLLVLILNLLSKS